MDAFEPIRYNLLSIVTFLPLVGALFVFLLPARNARIVAFVSSLVTFVVSLSLWFGFDPAAPGMQFLARYYWIEDLGITYSVGIDGISLLLVLLTTFITPIVILGSFTAVQEKIRAYMGLMLLLETGMLGAFVALDIFLFYVFWEAMLVPMYIIIGVWGGPRRIYAAVKFFLFTIVGSLLMLVAILVLYFEYHDTVGAGTYSAYILDLYKVGLTPRLQFWLFGAFALAFAIKVPMFPLHTWLPDAHVEAPTGGSVILAAILLKMGTYGFVRFAIPLFPVAAADLAPLIRTLAVIGIVYGALVAMVQPDVKKLVAYSSVSHLGFVMLGLFAFNVQGIEGAVYQMLSHGLSTGGLFLLVGVIYERRHTRLISEFGGLAKIMPAYAFVFMIVTLASIGLPGLNGFVGEFLILLGSFQRAPVFAAFAATGVVLGAVYMLWMFRRVMFGPVVNKANLGLRDLTRREVWVLSPVVVMIFIMGILPRPFLSRMEPAVTDLVAAVEREAGYRLAAREEASRGMDTPGEVQVAEREDALESGR